MNRAVEVEANWFAASLCMPQKLIAQAFRARFGSLDFVQTDDSIFWVGECSSSVELASILSLASQYGGCSFMSLKECFRVSPAAMSFRLLELGFIRSFGRSARTLTAPPRFIFSE
jgi:hypothetical protein